MLLSAKKIVLKESMIYDSMIEVKDGIITKIIGDDKEDCLCSGLEVVNFDDFLDKEDFYKYVVDSKDDIVLEFGNRIISAGFVDTHIHGYSGCDVMDNDGEGLKIISKEILKIGVTSFLPTTLTASAETLNNVVGTVAQYKDECDGAKIRGIFLEGPFFTEKHKGAQNPDYFSAPDIQKLKKWQEVSKGLIKKIAVAPEYDNTAEFIQEAKKIGVNVALGHSDATYDEAKKAIDSGASIFVHTYNAMSPLHHRNPGMVGAALTSDDVYAELICDGHHVHPVSAEVVVRCKTYNKVALITDCMMAGGMKDGKYKLGEYDVEVGGGTARLKTGNLAGSILKLKDGIKNVIDWKIADEFEAIHMATYVPAKSVGIDDVCGVIDIGREADIVVLDMDKYSVDCVLLDGKIQHI